MSLFSLSFLLFLTITFLAYYLFPAKLRNIILLLAGYVFCLSYGWKCVVTVILITLITYFFGRLLNNNSNRIYLFLSVILSLGVLLTARITDVLPAVGISFFSLQAIGYVADVYNRKTTVCSSFIDYCLYVSFFPTFLSGPIERSTTLLPQIKSRKESFDFDRVKSGLWCMLGGYCLKLIIADRLSLIVTPAFDNVNNATGGTLAVAAILYGIQLYADFAGYSLLVLGVARVFGFEINQNFKQPYFALSVRDFWNRWHISLSSFLRDYVYIPLGGSRCGAFRIGLNLLITFAVSGLWHGNGWTFLVWGLLHGIYQIVGRMLAKKGKSKSAAAKPIVKVICAIRTFILVDFAWIFFRASSLNDALTIVRKIFTEFAPGQTFGNSEFLMGYSGLRFCLLIIELIIWLVIDILHERDKSVIAYLNEKNVVLRYLVYVCVALVLFVAVIHDLGMGNSGFIYANF